MQITFEGTMEEIVEACGELAQRHKMSLKDQNWEAWKTSLLTAYMDSGNDDFFREWFREIA